MQISVKCAMCGNVFKADENDLCLEIDFKAQTISYICRNPKCRHDNILDLSNWKQQQKHSPLPPISTSNY